MAAPRRDAQNRRERLALGERRRQPTDPAVCDAVGVETEPRRTTRTTLTDESRPIDRVFNPCRNPSTEWHGDIGTAGGTLNQPQLGFLVI